MPWASGLTCGLTNMLYSGVTTQMVCRGQYLPDDFIHFSHKHFWKILFVKFFVRKQVRFWNNLLPNNLKGIYNLNIDPFLLTGDC